MLDDREQLNSATGGLVPQLAETAARFAGQVVLKLVHDHLLRLDLVKYSKIIRNHVVQINMNINNIRRVSVQF